MSLEERAAYLQNLKEQACLDPVDARARLLSELTDTVSMLCHRIYSIDSVVNGLNETLDEVQELLFFCRTWYRHILFPVRFPQSDP